MTIEKAVNERQANSGCGKCFCIFATIVVLVSFGIVGVLYKNQILNEFKKFSK